MKKYRLAPDGSFAPPPADYVNSVVLAAGTAAVMLVPTGAMYALINATGDIFARFNVAVGGLAAAVPGAISDGSASELNPAMRCVAGIAEISFISQTTAVVTVAYYGG